jgi:hypothetical protein
MYLDLQEGSCDRTPFEPEERKEDQLWQLSAHYLCMFGHHEHRPCTASVRLMYGVLSKPVCVRKMSLSAGLKLGGQRFPQRRMLVC